MNKTSSTRPTGVKIIALLWIVVGAFMVLSVGMGGIAYSMMRQMDTPALPGSNVPLGFGLMNLMLQNFGAVLTVQCLVAVVAIWAGIGLLRLRTWARSTIEALCWVGVLWMLGFGVYWVYTWVLLTGQMPEGAMRGGSDSYQMMGAVMGVVGMLVFVIPLGIMIRYLRRREVRGVFTRHTNAYG